MKTRILAILGLALMLCGCKTTVKENTDEVLWDKFEVVESRTNPDYGGLYTIYDKDTKVMYFYIRGYQNTSMSPIYNSDGSVMVYEGAE